MRMVGLELPALILESDEDIREIVRSNLGIEYVNTIHPEMVLQDTFSKHRKLIYERIASQSHLNTN